MRAITGLIFSFIFLIVTMLVGSLIITGVAAHANDSGQLVDDAATAWTNMMTYVWLALFIIAFAPLIMVLVVFSGMFGMVGGGTK
jgi:hypothetical protein